MTDVSIACAINNRPTAEQYLLRSLDGLSGEPPVRFLLDNQSNLVSHNIAGLYNLLARLEGPPIRVFTHADVTFPADFVQRIGSAVTELERSGVAWGALGTVGRAWSGEYVWGHEIGEPAEVCAVDSCCLVIDTRQALTFDDRRFDRYHCYVEDYCMQCHAVGLGVLVFPSVLEHVGETYAREGSRWGNYDKYRKRLARKWRGQFPALTTT